MKISEPQREELKKISADLRIQSMMFDMEIDWETLSLVSKSKFKEPFWLTRWKEQVSNGDNQAEFNVDLEEE